MRINRILTKRTSGAFTLIEMIGVLSVIAILASVLVPKVFNAIANARASNAAMSVNAIKSGIADHYSKYGSIAWNGALSTPGPITVPGLGLGAYSNYDQVLVAENILDKPFQTKLGTGTPATDVYLLTAPSTNGGAVTASALTATVPGDAYFDLGGVGSNSISGTVVAVAVIQGCTLEDARNLNGIIDGPSMGESSTGYDILGRVKYNMGSGPGTVYVYLTHR